MMIRTISSNRVHMVYRVRRDRKLGSMSCRRARTGADCLQDDRAYMVSRSEHNHSREKSAWLHRLLSVSPRP
jgi:hypothetical protein